MYAYSHSVESFQTYKVWEKIEDTKWHPYSLGFCYVLMAKQSNQHKTVHKHVDFKQHTMCMNSIIKKLI